MELYFPMRDVMVSTLLAIYKFSCVPCWECFALLRTLGGKGSSSPVWSSGRGLVRVLYPLACVKQWGGDRCFTLFQLVASIVPDVRCIDVFTHNSLRDNGDSLAALSGTHRTICSRKLDIVVGWEVVENQSLIMITMFEDFRWMWCYVWFGMIGWILGLCVQTKYWFWS